MIDCEKVVIEMTEKPQGAALVVDGDNQLLGIVTEGDLRRCLANNGDIDSINRGRSDDIQPGCSDRRCAPERCSYNDGGQEIPRYPFCRW